MRVEDDADDNELRDDGWNEQARDETPMQCPRKRKYPIPRQGSCP